MYKFRFKAYFVKFLVDSWKRPLSKMQFSFSLPSIIKPCFPLKINCSHLSINYHDILPLMTKPTYRLVHQTFPFIRLKSHKAPTRFSLDNDEIDIIRSLFLSLTWRQRGKVHHPNILSRWIHWLHSTSTTICYFLYSISGIMCLQSSMNRFFGLPIRRK